MSVDAKIIGGKGKNSTLSEVHVHPFVLAGNAVHHGLVVLTEPFVALEPSTKFFLNDTFGAAMNQNIAFGTVAITIHDGGTSANGDSGTADTNTTNHIIQAGQNFASTVVVGSYATATNTGHVTVVADTDLTCSADICPLGNEAFTIDPVWTGSAVQGTWNFADSAKITLTSASNNDAATFDSATTARYDWENFTAFTGKVDLDTFSDANHTIVMQFELNGTLVGNSVNLNDFIDTSDFTEQSFAITKVNFGLANGSLVNSLRVTLLRTGGAKPTFKLDDLQLEASGDPAVFSLNVDRGDRFHIEELVFAYADDVDSQDNADASMPNLAYDAILGVSALTIGFTITRSKGGKTLTSATIKTLGAHISAGAKADEPWSDGTNTFVVLRAIFKAPLILSGDADDTLTITINDPMNGLIQFTAAARGGLESPV